MNKKDLKNIILGCIFGTTVTSIIGVSALISTGTLSYTPKDSTWNVNTAQGALDSLYDTSLTGKNNIITALNSKGLSLDNSTEYSNIIDGINSLPVGKTESGEWGFIPEGEKVAKPYGEGIKTISGSWYVQGKNDGTGSGWGQAYHYLNVSGFKTATFSGLTSEVTCIGYRADNSTVSFGNSTYNIEDIVKIRFYSYKWTTGTGWSSSATAYYTFTTE